MAWLEQRGPTYHLVFRLGNQRFKKSLKTQDEREAASILERAERRLRLIEQGEVDLPDDADLSTLHRVRRLAEETSQSEAKAEFVRAG